MESVKAFQYEVKITTDIVHGSIELIKEIFIPSQNTIINKEYIFYSEYHRDDNYTEIDIPNDLANDIGRVAKLRREADTLQKKVMNHETMLSVFPLPPWVKHMRGYANGGQ